MTDEAAFRAYVTTRQRGLLRTAWLLTGDWAEAEDLVQAALVRCWPRWDAITQRAGEDAYVRRAVVNGFLSSRRRMWHRETATARLPDAPGPDEYAASDLRAALVAALHQLPARQRAVLVLRWFEDLSEAQIAAALGCSPGTVKSQSSKALAALRRDPSLSDLDVTGSRS